MQRLVLTALLLGAGIMTAHAQTHPLSLDSTLYLTPASPLPAARPHDPRARTPEPRQADVGRTDHRAPPVRMAQAMRPDYRAANRRDLGGGFIEFLFGGFAPPERNRHDFAMPALPPPNTEPVQPLIRQAYAPAGPAVRPGMPQMDPRFLPRVIAYAGKEKPGTIIINTPERFLYLVLEGGRAKRYGIGVGRPGFTWAGMHKVTAKREWPDWRPPEQMLKRQPQLPEFMPGGPNNPLGARAMYLGSTLYRIHGSNEPWTIGRAVSSGCIRMRNEDVIDLYDRVAVGTKVMVI